MYWELQDYLLLIQRGIATVLIGAGRDCLIDWNNLGGKQ